MAHDAEIPRTSTSHAVAGAPPRAVAAGRGRDFWRSIEELAAPEELQRLLARELPGQAGEWGRDSTLDSDSLSRRRFLELMGASLALAGVAGCTRQPEETIVPYVKQPEEVIPGRPLFFATAMPLSGYATGILVESHMGRPTKIEGNPEHPASLGATDVLAQASILGLYDPDRSQAISRLGAISTWGSEGA